MTTSNVILRISALILALWANSVAALSCQNLLFEDKSYSACTVDLSNDQLRLFLQDQNQRVLGHFNAIPRSVQFAMNAGMYHADRQPVGLYVENGIEHRPIITAAGSGNFGLLPNGILCINSDTAYVMETRAFVARKPDCTFATQSGPMLVIDGALHPRFIPNSPYTNIRNGVGTSPDGRTAHFAISNEPVSFDQFARLFRDFFGVRQALYLDGSISRLYAPDLNRNDFGVRLGPMVAVVD